MMGNTKKTDLYNHLDSLKMQRIHWKNYDDIAIDNEPPDFTDIYHDLTSKLPLAAKRKKISFFVLGFSTAAAIALLITLFVYPGRYSGNNFISVTTGGDEIKTVSLPDGSTIWLNGGSSVHYNRKFSKNRHVFLTGEACFDVKHDERHPFYVETSDITVKVLGTRFNMSAILTDDFVETTVEEGTVYLSSLDDSRTKKLGYTLTSQMQSVFNKDDREYEVKNVNAAVFTSWRYGRREFNNEEIGNILDKISEWYDLEIDMPENIKDKYRFTITIRDENPETVFKLFEKTSALTFTMDGKKVSVKENK